RNALLWVVLEIRAFSFMWRLFSRGVSRDGGSPSTVFIMKTVDFYGYSAFCFRWAAWSFLVVTLVVNTAIALTWGSVFGKPSIMSASSGSAIASFTFAHCLDAM